MNVTPNRPEMAPGANRPGASSSARTRAAGPDGPRPASGQVELSSRAQEFVRLRSLLPALPAESRSEHVARLQTLVARGEYAVDGRRIADAMVQDEAVALLLGLRPA